MDIQEAIEALKTLYPKKCRLIDGRYKGGFDNHDCKEGKALDIAIRALEMQIVMKENLADECMCNNMILKKFIIE